MTRFHNSPFFLIPYQLAQQARALIRLEWNKHSSLLGNLLGTKKMKFCEYGPRFVNMKLGGSTCLG